MIINSKTTKEEVREQMKKTLVKMCSNCKESKESISSSIRSQFDAVRKIEADQKIEDEVLNRILGIQTLISEKKKVDISLEELIDFLSETVNYGDFQIWLSDIAEQGDKLSKPEKIKVLLARTSDNDIIKLYSIERNYDQVNLNNITEMINRENGCVVETKNRSNKALVKSLLN